MGDWRPAERPRKAEMIEAEDPLVESSHPPFYPFPLRANDDDDR